MPVDFREGNVFRFVSETPTRGGRWTVDPPPGVDVEESRAESQFWLDVGSSGELFHPGDYAHRSPVRW